MEQPVIIIGMHRSGTTLLSKLLENLGIFMGKKKEENNEALFFFKFNEFIFRQCNATWDNPYNITFLDKEYKSFIKSCANKYLCSWRKIEYLGFEKNFKYSSIKNLNFPWGWKDPRNTFTLEMWLDIFPNAKVIHIYRNPVDVAESLRKRNEKYRREYKWTIVNKLKFFFLELKLYLGYGNSIRISNIYEGVKLWEEYVSQAFKIEKQREIEMLHIKYEDFLENPIETVNVITSYLSLDTDVNTNKIDQFVNKINPKRKYAFTQENHLIDVYKNIQNNQLVKRLGYGDLGSKRV